MKPKQKLKFSSNNTIKDRFYVYYHITNEGDIFYIGKGYYNRAYQTRSRSKEWENVVKNCKDGYGVCFFAFGLTDKEARDLEKKLIKEGFKEGLPLVNKTHGGQGVSRSFNKDRLKKFRLKAGKRVYCYQNRKVYLSTSEAAEDLNLHQTHVNYCCNGKSKQAKGYEFDYVENLKNNFGKRRPLAKNEKEAIKIVCEQTGVVYNSLYELTKKTGIEGSHVSNQIKGKLKSVKGYTFKYYNEGDTIVKKPRCNNFIKKVKCLNNNKIYNSMSHVSRELNIDARMVKKVCEGKLKQSKGLKFKYLYN